VCISWKLKCWMLLMHGVTMKFTSKCLEVSVAPLCCRHYPMSLCSQLPNLRCRFESALRISHYVI